MTRNFVPKPERQINPQTGVPYHAEAVTATHATHPTPSTEDTYERITCDNVIWRVR